MLRESQLPNKDRSPIGLTRRKAVYDFGSTFLYARISVAISDWLMLLFLDQTDAVIVNAQD